MERLPLELTVNGRTHMVEASPQTTLLQVLREDLQLKGAKDACGLEQCGACRVIIDGEALPSCRMSAREAVGKTLVTVEGLATQGELSLIAGSLRKRTGHTVRVLCSRNAHDRYCVIGTESQPVSGRDSDRYAA